MADRKASGGEAEPVAWQYRHESNDGWCMLKDGIDPTEFLKQWSGIKYIVRPLYATAPEGQASVVRVPKVRTNHYRNKEKAARLQAIVDKKYAALGKETKT